MTLSLRSVVLLGIAAASGVVQAQNYRIAQSLDTHGFATWGGNGSTAYGRYLAPNGEWHAYVTSNAGFRDMADTGMDFVYASNSLGEYVGAAGSNHAVFYDGATTHDLGTFGGQWANGRGINDQGQILINASQDGRSGIYDHGTFTPFAPQGIYTVPAAINGAGQAVGALYDFNDPNGSYAFRFTNGVLEQLGSLPGGSLTKATALSESGIVAGQSYMPNGYTHDFLWQNGTMTDISLSLEGVGSIVGVNDAGTALTAEGALYRDGQWFSLNDLRAAQDRDWTITRAWSIDNDGNILAEAYQKVGFKDVYKAVALERTTDPVPEPASFAALGLGALALVRQRKACRAGNGSIVENG